MKKYKNIIFDCDGTLLDSRSATLGAFSDFTNEFLKRELTDDEIYNIFHQPSIESMNQIGIPTSTANILKLSEYFDKHSEGLTFFPGLEDVLKILKDKNIHMGLATNRDIRETEYALEENRLGEYCQAYVCREHVQNPKPSGDMLTYYLDKMGLNKDETIFIGNAISDHLAALDAGIDFAYFMAGTSEIHDAGDYIKIEDAKDILELV